MTDNTEQKTVIVDVKIPFWSMVTLMVKFAIASIPAFIILYLIGVFCVVFCSAFFMGILHGIH